MIFKKPTNSLEGHHIKNEKPQAHSQAEQTIACVGCGKNISLKTLAETLYVCPFCARCQRVGARRRLGWICDAGTFVETDGDITSVNTLDFPGYDKKLKSAKQESGENEAVICGTCSIGSFGAAVFAMEPGFMMGSMGAAVGERITRLFERAAEARLSVVGFAVSGGARMQEGIISLMQMAKTGGAVKRHSEAGLLYLSVLTDPTTGGVSASFAMEADIIIAEPQAIIGFTGPRVIEQTIRKKLPEGFQRAEFMFEKGFIDEIVERKNQKKYITQILKFHSSN